MKTNTFIPFFIFSLSLVPVSHGATVTNGSFDADGNVYWNHEAFISPPSMTGWLLTRRLYDDPTNPGVFRYPIAGLREDSFYKTTNSINDRLFSVFGNAVTETITSDLQGSITGLIPGNSYRLSFYYGGEHDGAFPNAAAEVQVSVNGFTALFNGYADSVDKTNADSASIPVGLTHKNTPFRQVSMDFAAANATEALNFVLIMSGGPSQLFLDSMSIEEIPEPSLSLTALLSAVGLLARRRR